MRVLASVARWAYDQFTRLPMDVQMWTIFTVVVIAGLFLGTGIILLALL